MLSSCFTSSKWNLSAVCLSYSTDIDINWNRWSDLSEQPSKWGIISFFFKNYFQLIEGLIG